MLNAASLAAILSGHVVRASLSCPLLYHVPGVAGVSVEEAQVTSGAPAVSIVRGGASAWTGGPRMARLRHCMVRGHFQRAPVTICGFYLPLLRSLWLWA
ncbi:hypothetical protein NDU88_001177 [Pleurodeles waltl]|uniref:Secreted protein n=1 Tax=Pleurodeles waltl TaxID=8319 RepID=A0AAV7L017_PLEWA|nr:hypothetical protein NDU88_001177 [Pleurodeles waltl]